MSKTTKIILTVVIVWGLLPIVVFPFISLFSDDEEDEKAKQEQQQEVKQKVKQKKMVYDQPFCATFGMSEDFRPDDYNLHSLSVNLDGVAMIKHKFNDNCDYYRYETLGDKVILRGDCQFSKTGYGVLQLSRQKPSDIVLQVAKEDSEEAFTGVSADSKATYRVREMRVRGMMKNGGVPFYQKVKDMLKEEPQNLWVATSDVVEVCNKRDGERDCIVDFKKGDLIHAFRDTLSDEYLVVPYIDGKSLYFPAADVQPVTSTQQLVSLFNGNLSRMDRMEKWNKFVLERQHNHEVRGYFNGWKAGKLASNGFPVFSAWLLLLWLAALYDWFNNITLNKWSLMLFTIFELWYFGTLGSEGFWTFSADMAMMIGSIFVFLLVIIVQQLFIYHVLDDLMMENDVDDTVSPWLEYLPLAGSVFGIVFVITRGWAFNYTFLAIYGLLMLGSLPSTIAYCRHSRKRYSMFCFMFLCKPASYIIMVIASLMKFGADALKYGSTGSSNEEDPYVGSFVNSDGERINVTRMPNGALVDNDGNYYNEGSGGVYRSGGSGGPYHK